jgi:hypothetical protein
MARSTALAVHDHVAPRGAMSSTHVAHDTTGAAIFNGTAITLLWSTLLLPFGLLTTNITFGLPIPETVPLVFVLVGGLLIACRGQLRHPALLCVPLIMAAYGAFGMLTARPLDGVRIMGSAIVLVITTQLTLASLPKACRISVYVLVVLRALSLVFPGPIAGFYGLLGLRGAEVYDGGASVLFAEPSYLASAVFSLWAVGRMGMAQTKSHLHALDLCAAALLLLSFSASAAAYALLGMLICLRKRPLLLASAGAAAAGLFSWLVAAEGTRVHRLVEAIWALIQEGGISAFVLIDPSTTLRMSTTFLAIVAAIDAPFGQFRLEMTHLIGLASQMDTLGVITGNPLLNDFSGNLQGNTVLLQLLLYGGWPLFLVLAFPAWLAAFRLWKLRRIEPSSVLVLAALASGCLVQSLLTSPFLFLCILVGLYWPNRSTQSERVAGASAAN